MKIWDIRITLTDSSELTLHPKSNSRATAIQTAITDLHHIQQENIEKIVVKLI